MNELLKINYDTETPTVSARDLHEQLHIKTAFKDWFPRMCEYGFEDGKDFSSKMSESTGGRPSKEYDISIDMAKQICMIQRTPEGKEIRQYFLDLEKAWNTPEQIMARALKMADRTIESVKAQCKFLGDQVIEQQQIITELQPKANYVDTILQSKSLVTITPVGTQLDRIKNVKVARYLYSKSSIEDELATETLTYDGENTIYYMSDACYGYTVSIEDGKSGQSANVVSSGAYYVEIAVSGVAIGETVNITVKGYKYNVSTAYTVQTVNNRGTDKEWQNPIRWCWWNL